MDIENMVIGASTINLNDPQTLMAIAKTIPTPTSFLKDWFFPTKAEYIFPTETILVDMISRGRKPAPFVIAGSKDMGRDDFTTNSYKPPRIAPSRTTTLDDLKKRGFGEQVFGGSDPEKRAIKMTAQDMIELSNAITRREEIMCSEILRTNACTMAHYENGNSATVKADAHVIKFYKTTNQQIYTPSTAWNKSGADILKDLNEMRSMIAQRGNSANILLVSGDVADIIINDAKIQKMLDIRRYEMGVVDSSTLPSGVSKICTLNVHGTLIDVICYEETYENEEGIATPYLPKGTAILTAKDCGCGLYGGVTQLEDGSDEFKYYSSRRVPKLIKDVVNDTKKLQMVAKPVMIPNGEFTWVSANVISE